MSQPMTAALVDVPCVVVLRTTTSLIVAASGRRVTIPASQVFGTTSETVTIPAHLAASLGLVAVNACLKVQQLAARFGRSADWVYRHVDRLIADEGFPKPATAVGQKVWDPASVEAWFGRHNPAAPVPVVEPIADLVEQDRARLAAAYGTGAAA